MSTTVREAIENARVNIQTVARLSRSPIAILADMQLGNALEALGNGMGLDDVMQDDMLSDVKTKP